MDVNCNEKIIKKVNRKIYPQIGYITYQKALLSTESRFKKLK